MKRLLLVLALTATGVVAGCQAFTPRAAQDGVATLHQDVDELRVVLAAVTSNAKILETLDAIAANVSRVDTILNK